jgi:hypothetical protein
VDGGEEGEAVSGVAGANIVCGTRYFISSKEKEPVMHWKVHVAALGVLAASLPALANTASDNVVWSAKPVVAARAQPECTAYSGRQINDASLTPSDPIAKTLKVVGTLAATAAISFASKTGPVTQPNPCKGF